MPGGQRGGSSPSDALDTDANPSCLTEEKDRLSQRAPRRGGATRTAPRDHARSGTPDGEGVIGVLLPDPQSWAQAIRTNEWRDTTG